ncbi:hypothetical protein HMPREF2128_07515 [Pseudoglutamicibacter albus DNF00011]|uniref:Uncharacterized protein n=1 Tax=Pseudoglutamicibacter albus DNF00011 TaxID=1401063 RepID=A0A095YDA5_9MICC|nr:hypothetical protein HMPREF2128_07515 [Pseudoglutamicibacter albus DNF00011]
MTHATEVKWVTSQIFRARDSQIPGFTLSLTIIFTEGRFKGDLFPWIRIGYVLVAADLYFIRHDTIDTSRIDTTGQGRKRDG